MPVPRLPRVPDRLPFPDTSGAEPSPAALDELWSKTRSVRVYAGELGEHGPLARAHTIEISGAPLAELRTLLAFEPPEARFRVLSLGQCALELRGRALRVGLVGLEQSGVLRVAGWGSDARLRDPRALFAWLAARGGPSIALEPRPQVESTSARAADAWVEAAPPALAATAARIAAGSAIEPSRVGPEADAFARAEPDAARRIGALLTWSAASGTGHPRPTGTADLAALPTALLTHERIADVLDFVESPTLDGARLDAAAAYLAPLRGHGLVVERRAGWTERLRDKLGLANAAESCDDVAGGRVVATSAYGAELRRLVVGTELVAALDGPFLVRFDGAAGPRALGRMADLFGQDGGAIVGPRDSDLVAVSLADADTPARTLRAWSRPAGATAIVASGRLFAVDADRRGADEPSSRLTSEALEGGAPNAAWKAQRGVVTGLSAAGRAVLAVVRRSHRPWFGAPRARHELLLATEDGGQPSVVHRVDTEPGVAFALGVSAPEGVRAWLWSPGRPAVIWVDVGSGAAGELDAGAPVWGLCASAHTAWAARATAGRLEIVRLQSGKALEVVGSARAAPRQVEIREGAGAIHVAAYDKLVAFPRPAEDVGKSASGRVSSRGRTGR